jgi:ribosomal protein S15P/S13E
MAITTLEVACGAQHKEIIVALLEHLKQHFTDLHNAAQNSSMSEKTLKQARYYEGRASAYSHAAFYIDGIVLK